MIKAYDRIVLTEDIPGTNFRQGDVGTVAMIHHNGKGFEVEFFTLEGKTLAIETLLAHQVRAVEADEVAHVRKIA